MRWCCTADRAGESSVSYLATPKSSERQETLDDYNDPLLDAAVDRLASNEEKMDERKRRREAFGRQLKSAIVAHGVKQADLATRVGGNSATLSNWIRGNNEPWCDDVFKLEQELELAPGALSQHLGYYPPPDDAEVGRPSVVAAIIEDPDLNDEQREHLRHFYETMKMAVWRPRGS